MAASKKRRGPHSQKSQKRKQPHRRAGAKATMPGSQTNEPFEQDTKRRIGQHMGTGRAPLMKK
jgi:hypothetical protein